MPTLELLWGKEFTAEVIADTMKLFGPDYNYNQLLAVAISKLLREKPINEKT